MDPTDPKEVPDSPQPTEKQAPDQDPATITPSANEPGAVPAQNPAGAISVQYQAGAVAGQYPAGVVPGQYPAGAVPGQYPPGMVPGQYPAGMAPGQFPPGMVPGQYPPGMVPGQYPPGMVPGQYPGVVFNQPGMPMAVQLMPPPEPIPGCPPGLEYLAQLDQLLVHQQIELAEMVTNIQFANKYVIKNSVGQQVYFAKEVSDDCMRICCGPARGFVINITDNMGREVLRLSRVFKCCAGCCWCSSAGGHCSFFIEVESPESGQVLGYVRQTMSFASPCFDVRNESDQTTLKIRGHWCRCQTICCQNDINFRIFTPDMNNEVGKISKQWGGWIREAVTQADNFGVEFPKDMDVKMKAVLLASTFLIDFMFFENPKNNNNN